MADENDKAASDRRAAEAAKRSRESSRQEEQQMRQRAEPQKQAGESDEAFAQRQNYERADQRAEEIRDHEEEKQRMFDESTDAALEEAAPALAEGGGGGHFLGGMDIVDTRKSRPTFGPQVADPHFAAKQQIGEENRSFGRQTDRDVARARERNPNDPSAMAEAAARR